MNVLEIMIVWLAGGISYCGIELLWQGKTHWTMLILGGVCFLMMYRVNTRLRLPLPAKWALCALGVTGLEFCSGCLLNLWLKWNVWSYRGLPWNLLGQVCPLYALFWYLLSIPGTWLSLLLYRWFHSAAACSARGAYESSVTCPGDAAQLRTDRDCR